MSNKRNIASSGIDLEYGASKTKTKLLTGVAISALSVVSIVGGLSVNLNSSYATEYVPFNNNGIDLSGGAASGLQDAAAAPAAQVQFAPGGWIRLTAPFANNNFVFDTAAAFNGVVSGIDLNTPPNGGLKITNAASAVSLGSVIDSNGAVQSSILLGGSRLTLTGVIPTDGPDAAIWNGKNNNYSAVPLFDIGGASVLAIDTTLATTPAVAGYTGGNNGTITWAGQFIAANAAAGSGLTVNSHFILTNPAPDLQNIGNAAAAVGQTLKISPGAGSISYSDILYNGYGYVGLQIQPVGVVAAGGITGPNTQTLLTDAAKIKATFIVDATNATVPVTYKLAAGKGGVGSILAAGDGQGAVVLAGAKQGLIIDAADVNQAIGTANVARIGELWFTSTDANKAVTIGGANQVSIYAQKIYIDSSFQGNINFNKNSVVDTTNKVPLPADKATDGVLFLGDNATLNITNQFNTSVIDFNACDSTVVVNGNFTGGFRSAGSASGSGAGTVQLIGVAGGAVNELGTNGNAIGTVQVQVGAGGVTPTVDDAYVDKVIFASNTGGILTIKGQLNTISVDLVAAQIAGAGAGKFPGTLTSGFITGDVDASQGPGGTLTLTQSSTTKQAGVGQIGATNPLTLVTFSAGGNDVAIGGNKKISKATTFTFANDDVVTTVDTLQGNVTTAAGIGSLIFDAGSSGMVVGAGNDIGAPAAPLKLVATNAGGSLQFNNVYTNTFQVQNAADVVTVLNTLSNGGAGTILDYNNSGGSLSVGAGATINGINNANASTLVVLGLPPVNGTLVSGAINGSITITSKSGGAYILALAGVVTDKASIVIAAANENVTVNTPIENVDFQGLNGSITVNNPNVTFANVVSTGGDGTSGKGALIVNVVPGNPLTQQLGTISTTATSTPVYVKLNTGNNNGPVGGAVPYTLSNNAINANVVMTNAESVNFSNSNIGTIDFNNTPSVVNITGGVSFGKISSTGGVANGSALNITNVGTAAAPVNFGGFGDANNRIPALTMSAGAIQASQLYGTSLSLVNGAQFTFTGNLDLSNTIVSDGTGILAFDATGGDITAKFTGPMSAKQFVNTVNVVAGNVQVVSANNSLFANNIAFGANSGSIDVGSVDLGASNITTAATGNKTQQVVKVSGNQNLTGVIGASDKSRIIIELGTDSIVTANSSKIVNTYFTQTASKNGQQAGTLAIASNYSGVYPGSLKYPFKQYTVAVGVTSTIKYDALPKNKLTSPHVGTVNNNGTMNLENVYDAVTQVNLGNGAVHNYKKSVIAGTIDGPGQLSATDSIIAGNVGSKTALTSVKIEGGTILSNIRAQDINMSGKIIIGCDLSDYDFDSTSPTLSGPTTIQDGAVIAVPKLMNVDNVTFSKNGTLVLGVDFNGNFSNIFVSKGSTFSTANGTVTIGFYNDSSDSTRDNVTYELFSGPGSVKLGAVSLPPVTSIGPFDTLTFNCVNSNQITATRQSNIGPVLNRNIGGANGVLPDVIKALVDDQQLRAAVVDVYNNKGGFAGIKEMAQRLEDSGPSNTSAAVGIQEGILNLEGMGVVVNGGSMGGGSTSLLEGASAGDQGNGVSIFVNPFVQHGTYKKSGRSAGYKVHNGGASVGVEVATDSNSVFRISTIFYQSTVRYGDQLKGDRNKQPGWIIFAQATQNDVIANGTSISLAGFGGQSKNTGQHKRLTANGYDVAKFNNTTSTIGAQIGISYNYELPQNIHLKPELGLRWVNISNGSYEERGAGAQNCRANSTTINNITAKFGAGISGDFDIDGNTVTPIANLGYIVPLNSGSKSVYTTLGGRSIGVKTNVNNAVFNAGLALRVRVNASVPFTFGVGCDVLTGKRQRSVAGSAQVEFDL